jgi:hypothetical protein
MPLRAQQRETCHGSSDNVMVPIDEFRATMDGAIRLARLVAIAIAIAIAIYMEGAIAMAFAIAIAIAIASLYAICYMLYARCIMVYNVKHVICL